MTQPHTFSRSFQGFSLVEMMVAIILGLMVILAVGNIFIAGRKTINSTEAIGRIQETSNVAFELMGRDLREAGGNSCSSGLPLGNALNARTSAWWTNWANGLLGYEGGTAAPGTGSGTGVGQRVADSDALDIYSAFENVSNVVTKMGTKSANIAIEAGSGFVAGDILVVCDTEAAFLFQATGMSSNQVAHASGSGAPGNCANLFSYNDTCNSAATGYLFDTDSMVARATSYRWFVGNNADGGRSLYRARLTNTTTGAVPTITETVEVVAGVQNLDITYMLRGADDYVDASTVADWKQVTGVRLVLSMEANTNNAEAGMDDNGRVLTRQMTHTVAIRNH